MTLSEMWDALIKASATLKQLSASRETPVKQPTSNVTPKVDTPLTRLYNAAFSQLGKDLSHWAPNEVGCAESLSRVIKIVYPDFTVFEGTASLNSELSHSPHFKRVYMPQPGTVSIFPTQGATHGHCGVWGKNYVMNNNSATGKWDASYTFDEWHKTVERRGLKLYFYDPV